MKSCGLLVLLAACAADPSTSPDAMPPGEYHVTWSPGVNAEGLNASCTTTISHPCPFITYTTRFHDNGTQFVWDQATGGTDEAGISAENRLPWVDKREYLTDGSLYLESRGDDGGLRLQATLPAAPDGWAGTVSWDLFTVAGRTDFKVTVSNR